MRRRRRVRDVFISANNGLTMSRTARRILLPLRLQLRLRAPRTLMTMTMRATVRTMTSERFYTHFNDILTGRSSTSDPTDSSSSNTTATSGGSNYAPGNLTGAANVTSSVNITSGQLLAGGLQGDQGGQNSSTGTHHRTSTAVPSSTPSGNMAAGEYRMKYFPSDHGS